MRRWEGCWEVSGTPWSEVELNLPRGGHYLILVLPRGSDVAVAALLGALSQLPLPFLLKGGLGQVCWGWSWAQGPGGLCSGYSSVRWHLSYSVPKDIFFFFYQEEVLLGSMVCPKCFFEVSDI